MSLWVPSSEQHTVYIQNWHEKWFALLAQYNVVYFFSPIMTELAHYDGAGFSDSFTSCPRAGFITLWCRINWQLLMIRWCWCHLFFDMFSILGAPNGLLQCLQVITDRAKRQVTKYILLASLWLNSHLLLLKESFLFLESESSQLGTPLENAASHPWGQDYFLLHMITNPPQWQSWAETIVLSFETHRALCLGLLPSCCRGTFVW